MFGMIELLADQLLALETLMEGDVALVLHVRDLERDRGSRLRVGRLEDRGHPAAGEKLRHHVLVEPLPSDGFTHLLA